MIGREMSVSAPSHNSHPALIVHHNSHHLGPPRRRHHHHYRRCRLQRRRFRLHRRPHPVK